MTFSWRKRRNGHGGAGKSNKTSISDMELTIPSHFRCPISLDLMKDPVTLATGMTYDRESIERWIDAGNVTCPVTNQVLINLDQIPNHFIRKMIQDWCVEKKSYGVERIPTPRIPITPYEVSLISSRIAAASNHGDLKKCDELLRKIKNMAKESERNKRCIVDNGIGCTLAGSFESFAQLSNSSDAHVNLLKEILSVLTWTLQKDQEGVSKLRSTSSIRCMALFLKDEDLFSRQNAVFVLKELISVDQDSLDGLMEIEGIEETLIQILKVPICPRATKASLMVIHQMLLLTETRDTHPSEFVQMTLVSSIIETLVDNTDKSVCERALGVLDSICIWQEGRQNSRKNALTIPLVVKKILRVSNAATEFCVSVLWKLCLGENDESALVEAVQLGAFQKLLVVLQVGCGDRTKEKVTELLKVMNLYRDKLDCFDSSTGFKYLKRPN